MIPANQPWWSTRSFAVTMIAIAAVPLIWPVIPPVVDLPAHMGRYAVEVAPPDSPLRRYYDFQWALIGNLGVDLLVIPLSKLFGLELAVKLIVLAIPPLTVGAMLLVAREAHGYLPPTAAFALPLSYGFPFQFGFINFALSMALALFGLALWLRLGRMGHLKLRALILVPYGLMLWLVHSFGWGVLGLSAFAADLVRRHQRGKAWLKSAWEAGLATAPLMPPIALMLLWRSGQVAGTTEDWFHWAAKWYYLHSIIRSDATEFDLASSFFLLQLALLGLLPLFRRSWHLLLAALILACTFVLLPRIALGSAYADMRLAPYMVALFVLAFDSKANRWAPRNLVACVAVTFFVVSMALQTLTYLRIDRIYREQLAALDHIPVGARVFALADVPCLSASYRPRLEHLDAMVLVRRQGFTNGQWALAGAQLLTVKYKEAGAFSLDPTQLVLPDHCKQPGQSHYPDVLAQFPRHAFDFLWLINFEPRLWPSRDPGLEPVWKGAKGALYRIRRTPTGG